MSFSNLARHFRRSRSKGSSSGSSGNPQGDSSPHPSSGSVPLGTSGDDGAAAQTRIEMPTPMPAPWVASPPSMTMQEPSVPASTAAPSPMNGALAELTPLYRRLDDGPAVPREQKAMDMLGDKIGGLTKKANDTMTVINSISATTAAIEKTDFVQNIERGIQHFTDDIPWLMKGLDELARIHPAVTVVVLAFKAVYALETTRQENDRRVMTLYVEMKDMMMVMVQLKGVENRKHVGLDGLVLKDRLEELAEKTAQNIKDCANFCDTFLKKRLIVKVLKGPAWAEKLSGFVKTFTERKSDFQFALAMHTANSITDVKKQTIEIDAKLDVVIALFDRFLTAEERKLVAEVEREGGATKVRQSDKSLKALLELDISIRSAPTEKDTREKTAIKQREGLPGAREGRSVAKDGTSRGKDGVKQAAMPLDDLKWELREDIDDALDRNFGTFISKFELQVSLLQVALERYIRTENDRVIGAVKDAVTQGPHMKIKHPELRKIWQDMNWRGNVKARLFVMTLRDHYRDVIEDAQHASNSKGDIIVNDDWTLEYFGPSWLQPMMDAFDDDVSGYVTISEVNKVMDLQPASLGWSVPRWLAYWAVGWGLAATKYATAIDDTLCHMRDALPRILGMNRLAVDSYLTETWGPSLTLTGGVEWHGDPQLLARFQVYLDHEEERLRSNLEHVKYHIDASDTLSLVLGPRKLEKCILPLLYLLTQNHYRIIKAAQVEVLAEHELENARRTMETLFIAVRDRYSELQDLFTEQKLDPEAHFKKYARGLFINHSPFVDFWSVDNMFLFQLKSATEEDMDVTDLSGIELDLEGVVDTSQYDAIDDETEDDLLAPMPVNAVLGLWNGFPFEESEYPARGMLSLRFHYSDKEGENFMGSGVEFDGDRYTISGTCEVDEAGQVSMSFSMTYGDLVIYYSARLLDEFTLEGWRGYEPDQLDDWQFVLKKVPAEQMFFRPSPKVLRSSDRPRKLWQYAISTIVHDIRRKNWSWSYFALRRDARKRYVRLFAVSYGRLMPYEAEEWILARLLCTAKDARFYHSLTERFNRIFPLHQPRWCDNCFSVIGGARLVCLDCVVQKANYHDRINFCDDPVCSASTSESVDGFGQDHHSGHDFMKVRTIVNAVEMAELLFKAQCALENYRGLSGYGSHPCPPDAPGDSVVENQAEQEVNGDETESPPNDGEPASQNAQTEYQDIVSDESGSVLESAPKRTDEAHLVCPSPQEETPQLALVTAEPSVAIGQTSEGAMLPDAVTHSDPTSSSIEALHDNNLSIPDPPELNTAIPDSPRPASESLEHPDAEPSGEDTADDDAYEEPPPQECKCRVCQNPVYIGKCWFCLVCEDFVCNDCDAHLFIHCHECSKPFPQPEWYSGMRASDFICPMCSAKGVKERPDIFDNGDRSHVGMHPLVQCKHKVPDPPKETSEVAEVSSEQRLASLEERMAAMDSKLEHLQEHLVRLEKTQTDMQDVILSRLDEALLRVVERVLNGQVRPDS
ncbi:hypothetical protein VTO73DRAFT_8020 [Trametes versicolor]